MKKSGVRNSCKTVPLRKYCKNKLLEWTLHILDCQKFPCSNMFKITENCLDWNRNRFLCGLGIDSDKPDDLILELVDSEVELADVHLGVLRPRIQVKHLEH